VFLLQVCSTNDDAREMLPVMHSSRAHDFRASISYTAAAVMPAVCALVLLSQPQIAIQVEIRGEGSSV
jgi:hypothetical protein